MISPMGELSGIYQGLPRGWLMDTPYNSHLTIFITSKELYYILMPFFARFRTSSYPSEGRVEAEDLIVTKWSGWGDGGDGEVLLVIGSVRFGYPSPGSSAGRFVLFRDHRTLVPGSFVKRSVEVR